MRIVAILVFAVSAALAQDVASSGVDPRLEPPPDTAAFEKRAPSAVGTVATFTWPFAVVATLGLTEWDWFTSSFSAGESENYLIDKIGHAMATSGLTRIQRRLFTLCGHPRERATTLSVVSTFAAYTAMELGDATSWKYKFSTRDMVGNTAGILWVLAKDRFEFLRPFHFTFGYRDWTKLVDDPLSAYKDYANLYLAFTFDALPFASLGVGHTRESLISRNSRWLGVVSLRTAWVADVLGAGGKTLSAFRTLDDCVSIGFTFHLN